MLVNPFASSSASALEEPEAGDEILEKMWLMMPTIVSPPLASTTSTVAITFNPTSASGAMTPIDGSGAKAKVDVKATVRVQNSGGYAVYVGSNSSQLKNGSNVIDPVVSTTTYANLPVNKWGYSFIKGEASSNDNTNYTAMPATLRSTPLDTNTSTSIKDETRTYTLSFAANIGADKPAGIYTNQVTMSVVSSPREISDLTGITNMQEMTSEICASSAEGTSKQLKDTRDGKYYWVSKLADGKCWMTQNLDLDLSTGRALTPNDSDVATNWTPGFDTASQASASTVNDASHTETRSWNLGSYRISNPTASSDCGHPKSDLSQCASQFTSFATPTTANGDVNAHYIVGNYYQWNAATAGTGGTITSGQATSSICPKSWKLPTSNSTTIGSFGGLINAYSIGSNVTKLQARHSTLLEAEWLTKVSPIYSLMLELMVFIGRRQQVLAIRNLIVLASMALVVPVRQNGPIVIMVILSAALLDNMGGVWQDLNLFLDTSLGEVLQG